MCLLPCNNNDPELSSSVVLDNAKLAFQEILRNRFESNENFKGKKHQTPIKFEQSNE